MPKKVSKAKTSRKLPKGFSEISFYGIWDRVENRLIYISMDQEMVETEFDLEGYDQDQFAICRLETVIDVKSLEQ
jgi:hypothetical protein